MSRLKNKEAAIEVGKEVSAEVKAAFLTKIQIEGKKRGFKPGWAAYRYREMFNEWPPR
jgi:hypothetical protein